MTFKVHFSFDLAHTIFYNAIYCNTDILLHPYKQSPITSIFYATEMKLEMCDNDFRTLSIITIISLD